MDVIMLLLAYLILINQLQFDLNDSMTSTLNFLNDQSGILTLSSIVAAILFFFYEQRKQTKDRKQDFNERLCRISNTLLIDINELNDWYAGEECKQLKIKHYYAEYSQNLINTTSYQSVVNSGLITYFQLETQKELNSYYFYVTAHNQRIFFMAEMANTTLSTSDFSIGDKKLKESQAWIHNENELSKYETEIIKGLPIVKKLLNDELARLKK